MKTLHFSLIFAFPFLAIAQTGSVKVDNAGNLISPPNFLTQNIMAGAGIVITPVGNAISVAAIGSGNVTGPSSSMTNALTTYADGTGKILLNTNWTLLSNDFASPHGGTLTDNGNGGFALSVPTGQQVYIPQSALRFSQSVQSAPVYDDFDRPNVSLNGTFSPTKQAWNVAGLGSATSVIQHGKLAQTVSGINGNSYNWLYNGGPIGHIGGAFSFAAGDTSSNPLTLIAGSDESLATMLHLNFGFTNWALDKRLSGGSFVQLASGGYVLQLGGANYGVSMDIDSPNGTVTVKLPNGIRQTITDPDITTINPSYGAWQNAGDTLAYWTATEMGTLSKAESLRALGQGADTADITQLRGHGLAYRNQSIIASLTGGVGWYTIYTAGNFNGLPISGQLTMSALGSGTETLFQGYIQFSQAGIGVTPIVQTYASTLSQAIDQIRASYDNVNNLAQLDVHLNISAATALQCEFSGFATPVSAPAVGATALPSGNVVFTIQSQSNFATSGRFSIGSGITNITGNAGTESIDSRGSYAGNRYGYWNINGLGNFTANQIWGVNGVTSDTDAIEGMRLTSVGLHIGPGTVGTTAGNAATPLHVQTTGVSANLQSGVRIQDAGSASGDTVPDIEWVNSVGTGAAIDSVHTAASFAASLRFFTSIAATNTPTLALTLDALQNATSAGNIITSTVGKTLSVKSGSNSKSGTFTLISGSATVTNTSVTANSVIHVTVKTVSGTRAGLPDIVPTAGTGFQAAGGGSDNSTYNYWIEENN